MPQCLGPDEPVGSQTQLQDKFPAGDCFDQLALATVWLVRQQFNHPADNGKQRVHATKQSIFDFCFADRVTYVEGQRPVVRRPSFLSSSGDPYK